MPHINLPYGIDLFEQVRTRNCYYIDKTGFIRELLDETFSVNLITRPRRFGKTLTLSMLAGFFDIRKDSRSLFEGLQISRDLACCETWMNRRPVLFLTLKDVEGNHFENAYGMLKYTIASLCIEHAYLKNSDKVSPPDLAAFERLMYQEGSATDIQGALFTLIRMMHAHYGEKVILLVDEYDVPLAKAGDHGYYEEMLQVIKKFLGMVWKSNPALEFSVVTGCLRIAKESIFTGANNFVSNSISGKRYQNYFGFTEDEVRSLLEDAHLSHALPEMKKWYDGYLFGNQDIYCPWDVINHVRALMEDPGAAPENYWLDTSHNQIIRRFIDLADPSVNPKFETLLSGGVIQEHIWEDLTYDLTHSTAEHLWSILYLTGYLTQVSAENLPEGMVPQPGSKALRIPNEEIRSVFADTVKAWFTEQITARDRREFFQEWWNGEADRLTEEISDILFDTISYFDYREDFYHAFVAGLFSGARYEVRSNSEQGLGRADIIIKERRHRRAIVIEIKWAAQGDLEKECLEALDQIKEKQYVKNLQLEGYRTILCYGAAFTGKSCLVKCAGQMP